MEQKILTRQQFKQEEQREKQQKQPKQQKRIKVRLLPIWFRLIIVAVLIVFMVIIGAMIGYGAIGGGHVIDVFKISTWTHIGDIVKKGT